jgi:hypothetical protein
MKHEHGSTMLGDFDRMTKIDLAPTNDSVNEELTGLSHRNIEFFYFFPGWSSPVQASASADIVINNHQFSVGTKFDVFTPSAEVDTPQRGKPAFGPFAGKTNYFGLHPDLTTTPPQTAGFFANGRVLLPSQFQGGSPGEWGYVQTYRASIAARDSDGIALAPGMVYTEAGLDAAFPYNDNTFSTGSSKHSMNDTPGFEFGDPTKLNEVNYSAQFTTFVIFKPPGARSKWVSLADTRWRFRLVGERGPGRLVLNSAKSSADGGTVWTIPTKKLATWPLLYPSGLSLIPVPTP